MYFLLAMHGQLAWHVITKACYVVCPEQETAVGCCYDDRASTKQQAHQLPRVKAMHTYECYIMVAWVPGLNSEPTFTMDHTVFTVMKCNNHDFL